MGLKPMLLGRKSHVGHLCFRGRWARTRVEFADSIERARTLEFLSIFFFLYDTSGYINSIVNSPSFPLVVKRRRRILFASMFLERELGSRKVYKR